MNLKRPLLAGLLLLASVLPAAADRYLFPDAHQGAVTALAALPRDGYFATAGEDGSVRIWNLEKQRMIYKAQISQMTIRKLAIHPKKSQIAAVVTDGINTFRLLLWDWKSESLVYSVRLEELPLFLKFSPDGRILGYSKTEFNSLVLLDAATGKRIPSLTEGFGIVSSVYFNKTGSVILTYGPSGVLDYWDIRRSQRKNPKPIKTFPDLKKIRFAENGLYMAALMNDLLVLVDLRSGKGQKVAGPGNFLDLWLDSQTNTLSFLTKEDDRLVLYRKNLAGGEPEKLYSSDRIDPRRVTGFSTYGETSVVSLTSGQIYTIKDRKAQLIAGLRHADLKGAAILGSTLGCTTEEGLLLWDLDSMFGNSPEAPTSIPLTQSPRGLITDGSGWLTWTESGNPNRIVFHDSDGRETREIQTNAIPYSEILPQSESLLCLRQNGEMEIRDLSGRLLSSHRAFGTKAAAVIGTNALITGRTRDSQIDASRILIDPQTGQTVPLKDSLILTTNLSYDASLKILYGLGLENRNGTVRTVLSAFRGRFWEFEEPILSFPGEDPKATFLIDSESAKIYTTLGQGGIKAVSWDGVTRMDNTDHIPRNLIQNERYLCSVNEDNTLSFWSKLTGKWLCDLLIFENSQWVILSPKGMKASDAAMIKKGFLYKNTGYSGLR